MIQSGFGGWLWEIGNVRNELVISESGWSFCGKGGERHCGLAA